MFDYGYHGNDATDAPIKYGSNMSVFVHPHTEPASTQKIKGASKFSFPTLLQFLRKSLLMKMFEVLNCSETFIIRIWEQACEMSNLPTEKTVTETRFHLSELLNICFHNLAHITSRVFQCNLQLTLKCFHS